MKIAFVVLVLAAGTAVAAPQVPVRMARDGAAAADTSTVAWTRAPLQRVSGVHPHRVRLDPVVRWAPSTTDCNGQAATAAGYNVYAPSGTSIPTVLGTELTDCPPAQLPDRTKVQPLNNALLPCTTSPCTYATALARGTYTVAVTAVDSEGNESGISNTMTITVLNRPAAPAGVTVGK